MTLLFETKSRIIMRTLLALLGGLLVTCSPLFADPPLVAESEPLTAEEQLKKFHVPPGFRVELVAAEPDIRKPININFDTKGRLYATQSIEYPFPPREGETAKDEIRIFEDTDGDGKYDRASSFTTGLTIPIGICPLPEGAIGYSIPQIFLFKDQDRNGSSEERQVFFKTFGFQDTHGMASSFNYWVDGWVYGCHGFANSSKVAGADDRAIEMNSGNTYRFRPDGSKIEYHTHGQVNPFGLTIDPMGNIYSSDCHTRPIYLLLRGAYYPSFGKPHDGLGFGPEMIEHSHGSTGISGIAYYAAPNYPKEFQNNVYIGNPVTGRINRDQLEPHGSTYKAIEQPDFLSCDDPWFRPVDVRLGPDGALYIADFYNRIIGHYEVPLSHPGRDRERGRIWRVVHESQEPAPIPNLERESTPKLVERLGDPNLVVRTQATNLLVHQLEKQGNWGPLEEALHGSPEQVAHALWVFERIGELTEEVLTKHFSHSSPLVRVHAIKIAAERFSPNSGTRELQIKLQTLAGDEDGFVRRALADCLGRTLNPNHIPILLAIWNTAPEDDHNLIHTARMALRDILGSEENLAVAWRTDALIPHRPKVAELALAIPNGQAAEVVMIWIESDAAQPRRTEYLHHAIRYGSDELGARASQWALKFRTGKDGEQVDILRTASRAFREAGRPVPKTIREWGLEFAGNLLKRDVATAASVVEEMRLAELSGDLLDIGKQRTLQGDIRLSLFRISLGLDQKLALPKSQEFVLDSNEIIELRQQVAETLAGVNSEQSRAVVRDLFKHVPEPVSLHLARGLAGGRENSEFLLECFEKGEAPTKLIRDAVVNGRLTLLNANNDRHDRVARIAKDVPEEDERLAALINERKESFLKSKRDLARGAEVFKKNCAVCHRLNNEGQKVGPELDGVGIRGLDRLLEDTLSPSRNLDQAFRATVFELKNGQTPSGLVLRKEGQVVILIDDKGQEKRIDESEIVESNLIKVSPMPASLGEQIPPEDYDHLLEYLLNQKQVKEKTE